MGHRVTFSDGRTVTFRDQKRKHQKKYNKRAGWSLPYTYARGDRIRLPSKSLKHGDLFKVGRTCYVAYRTRNVCHGQPIHLK